MTEAKYISIVHIAEDVVDGVQLCFRCGIELSRSPLMHWQAGHQIGQQVRTSDGQITGGWADLDTPECVGIEPGDIECSI